MPPLIKIDEVSEGKSFPPEREQTRITEMKQYARWSDGNYLGLWDGWPERLQANFFKDIMDFWKEAIVGDRPVIDVDGNERANMIIEMFAPYLFNACEEVVGDMIRYGVGCFVIEKQLFPQSLDPLNWFPVREPKDEYEITPNIADIIAYTFNNSQTIKNEPTHIAIKVIQGGVVETRIHKLSGTQIGNRIQTIKNRSVTFPAVIPVKTYDQFYGISDFKGIKDYVAELHRRESSISKALDRHVNPHLSLPESSVVEQADGSIKLEAEGMVFPIADDASQKPEYITWDASFKSQDNAIQRAETRILSASKISPLLYRVSQGDVIPNIISGSALRRTSVVTVNRIKNIRRHLTEAIKDVILKVFELYQEFEAIPLERSALNITWSPPLSSFIDEAEALATLVQSDIIDPVTAKQLAEKISKPEAERKYDENKSRREADTSKGEGNPQEDKAKTDAKD